MIDTYLGNFNTSIINIPILVTSHNNSSLVHNCLGSIVGTTEVQTLQNKTIDALYNTITNLNNNNFGSDSIRNYDFILNYSSTGSLRAEDIYLDISNTIYDYIEDIPNNFIVKSLIEGNAIDITHITTGTYLINPILTSGGCVDNSNDEFKLSVDVDQYTIVISPDKLKVNLLYNEQFGNDISYDKIFRSYGYDDSVRADNIYYNKFYTIKEKLDGIEHGGRWNDRALLLKNGVNTLYQSTVDYINTPDGIVLESFDLEDGKRSLVDSTGTSCSYNMVGYYEGPGYIKTNSILIDSTTKLTKLLVTTLVDNITSSSNDITYDIGFWDYTLSEYVYLYTDLLCDIEYNISNIYYGGYTFSYGKFVYGFGLYGGSVYISPPYNICIKFNFNSDVGHIKGFGIEYEYITESLTGSMYLDEMYLDYDFIG
jgi:hypothetical protein